MFVVKLFQAFNLFRRRAKIERNTLVSFSMDDNISNVIIKKLKKR